MITIGLIILCVLVFIFQNAAIAENYAMITGLDFAEPWRFITSMFLHADFSHLFFNMFALLMFGPYLEKKVGSTMFLAIYLVSGILGGLGFELINAPGTMGLGASGAIYGIIGALAVLAPNMRVYIYFMPVPIQVAALLYAFIELISIGAADNIGHAAHLFGLVGGYALAVVNKKMKSDDVWS